jgi:hypothetical protein
MERSESVRPISDKKETNPSNNCPWAGLSMERDLATMLRHRPCRASDPPLACSTRQWWPAMESRNLPAIRSPAAPAICIVGYREVARDNDDSSMMDRAVDVDPSSLLSRSSFRSSVRWFQLGRSEILIFGGLKANDWSTLGDHRFRRTRLQLSTVC